MDKHSATPLMGAASVGNAATAKILIEMGTYWAMFKKPLQWKSIAPFKAIQKITTLSRGKLYLNYTYCFYFIQRRQNDSVNTEYIDWLMDG